MVDVVLTSGERRHVEVLANRGTSRRPLSAEEIATKFRLNCRLLGSAAAELEERLSRLTELEDCSTLLDDINPA